MKCRSCGKSAKKYTVNRGGTEITVELCENCYRRLYGEDGLSAEQESGKECSACGTTYEDFRRTGLVGCAECYNAFRKEITSMLGYIQRSARHVGKVPEGAGERYDDLRSLIALEDKLREELECAEREGDTGRAAELRAGLDAVVQKLRRTDL